MKTWKDRTFRANGSADDIIFIDTHNDKTRFIDRLVENPLY